MGTADEFGSVTWHAETGPGIVDFGSGRAPRNHGLVRQSPGIESRSDSIIFRFEGGFSIEIQGLG
ncbi:hypothetical protein [Nocardia aurantia]|uniref:hypothetical protein n=1 Tax=Nocardia aurantia TaxID=2585199 RepID=UPI001294FFCD|nr:hypothetical protein [Nocardia aurantia]